MEPRAMIGSNLETCKRGPPLIKLLGYEQREETVGVGGAWNVKHTHTHTHTVSLVIHRVDGTLGKDRTQYLHMLAWPPTNSITGL